MQEIRLGVARPGDVWRGEAWQGKARFLKPIMSQAWFDLDVAEIVAETERAMLEA
jgi:hypothetical protein